MKGLRDDRRIAKTKSQHRIEDFYACVLGCLLESTCNACVSWKLAWVQQITVTVW